MKKFGLAFVLAAALGAGTTLSVTAQAAPAGLSGQLGAAADGLNLLEQTQYIYGGRRYCWYRGGWHGPGWYRCGYARRHGLGWGGGTGWQGWQQGVQPQVRQPQSRQPGGVQPKAVQPQGVAPQGGQPAAVQPKAVQPQGVAPQGGQPKGAEPQGDQKNRRIIHIKVAPGRRLARQEAKNPPGLAWPAGFSVVMV